MIAPSYSIGGPSTLECDVLIVGSGAGGASAAGVCTEAGLDVVMLEEGPYVSTEDKPASAREALSRQWRCGGLTVALGQTPVAYAEGRCVGGSTEINSAIFQPTPGELLDHWAASYRIADFGETQLSRYFERAATAVNASATPEPLGPPSEILRNAGATLGWRVDALERGHRDCVGTNMCSYGCPTGGKQSMTNSLLLVALARGMRLIANCRATRLTIRGRRITSVHAVGRDVEGRRHHVTVRPRLIFLCAGAVHTPVLLQRSGLRRNIGSSLRCHPTIRCLAFFDSPVNAPAHRLPLYAITEFMPAQRIGGSVLTPPFFAMMLAEDWQRRRHLIEEISSAGAYYAMVRGEGTGRVRALPGFAEPVVTYGLRGADWRGLTDGISRLGQAMFAAGARAVYPSIYGHPGWKEPRQCDEFARDGLPFDRTNLMTIHLFSSCPPGEDVSRCATDSFGRVHGVENLVIADGSQIPESPGVNPQATIMALAFRAAERAVASPAESRRRAFAEATS